MPTTYELLEPAGFGDGEFGNPDTEDKEFSKGFGDNTTIYSEYTND